MGLSEFSSARYFQSIEYYLRRMERYPSTDAGPNRMRKMYGTPRESTVAGLAFNPVAQEGFE
jgi:hypothetical protein